MKAAAVLYRVLNIIVAYHGSSIFANRGIEYDGGILWKEFSTYLSDCSFGGFQKG